MFTLNLNGKWEMRKTGNEEWIEADVPGSVLNDLSNAGKICDPFFRDNEEGQKRLVYMIMSIKESFILIRNF